MPLPPVSARLAPARRKDELTNPYPEAVGLRMVLGAGVLVGAQIVGDGPPVTDDTVAEIGAVNGAGG